MRERIRIGTRKSKLALIQTDLVKSAVLEKFPQLRIEIVEISTKGDECLERPLTSFGGKGVFTQELEAALLSGEIDLAVHSAKDMPMQFPDGLCIGAVLERGNPADVVLTLDGTALRDLPKGAAVGTSSLRRELQIKNINPKVEVKQLRGNIQTRIRKLKEGQYDAILLAAAGLLRMGCEKDSEIFFEYLSEKEFLPAAGQGILAVESRENDLEELLLAIHSEEAAALLEAERSYLTEIGGTCNAPAAALCKREGARYILSACFARDGRHLVYATESIECKKAEPDRAAASLLGKRLARRVKFGKVFLVGAGPGDSDLFTKRGLDLVKKADVLVYDSLAPISLLNEAGAEAELIYAGKRSDRHYLSQEQINQLLADKAKAGKLVVRLKGGDPCIFGRGGEEAQALYAQGIPFEIVPGVSSVYSVPAYCGIPVTHREFASSFHVITGQESANKTEVLDYSVLAKEEGTLVFLMGLKNLPYIVAQLLRYGKDKDTKAAVLQEGTTARQKMAVATLGTIVKEAEKKQIKTPALAVIGDVVGLQSQLQWLGTKLLFGKRVLVTASRPMASKIGKLLKDAGAEPILFSLIMIQPKIEHSFVKEMEEIETYSWIVLTSANGVEAFFAALKMQRVDIRRLAHIKFAVIGDGTAKALAMRGIYCDHVPTAYSSQDMAKSLLRVLDERDRVLLLRAREASKKLPKALEQNGIAHEIVALYETKYDFRKQEALNRILKEVDYVSFASSSAVRAYFAMVSEENKNCCKHISIGPVTSKTAEELGIEIYKTAKVYTAEGILDLLLAEVEE